MPVPPGTTVPRPDLRGTAGASSRRGTIELVPFSTSAADLATLIRWAVATGRIPAKDQTLWEGRVAAGAAGREAYIEQLVGWRTQ